MARKRTRIDKLSAKERGRFDEWADKWIEIGLRTGPARGAPVNIPIAHWLINLAAALTLWALIAVAAWTLWP